LALIFQWVPIYGYLAAAAILSAYLFISVGTNIWKGLAEIKKRSAA